jgi:hypothetical protein
LAGSTWAVGVLSACLVNCSGLTNPFGESQQQKASNSTASANGGTGLEGDRYISYAACPSGVISLKTEVQVSQDHSQARYLMQDCGELADPVPIDPNSLQFSVSNPSVLVVNNELFDRWTGKVNQNVTIQECWSAPGVLPDLQILEKPTMSGHMFATLTTQGGSTTGIMKATRTAPGYLGSNGVASFNLDLSLSTVSFSFVGGATVDLPNMHCFSQLLPPPGSPHAFF